MQELQFLETGFAGCIHHAVREPIRKGMPRFSTRISQERRDPTPRERQIIVLVGAGLSAPKIGRRLKISPHTARNHLKNIYRKYDAHNRTEILLYAMRQRGLGPDGRSTAASMRRRSA